MGILAHTVVGPNLDIGGMGAFLGAHFFEKRAFTCLHPLTRCHFQQFLTKFFSQNSGH